MRSIFFPSFFDRLKVQLREHGRGHDLAECGCWRSTAQGMTTAAGRPRVEALANPRNR